MIAMCFLRCLLLFIAVVNVSHQVSVLHENPNISETDQCRISCGTKGQLPLTEIDGEFYYIYLDRANKKSWHEAYDFCRQHNMELATIDSAAENEAIKQHIKTKGLEKSYESYWIGLNSLATQGEFRWASTGKTATFTDWFPGEPNYLNTERCGEMYLKNGLLKWNNGNCHASSSVGFICDLPAKNFLYMHAN